MSYAFMDTQEKQTYELLSAVDACENFGYSPALMHLLTTAGIVELPENNLSFEAFGLEAAEDKTALRSQASAALAAHSAKFKTQMETADKDLDETTQTLDEKLKDPNCKLLGQSAAVSGALGLVVTGADLARVLYQDAIMKKEAEAMKKAAEEIAALKKKVPKLEMRPAAVVKVDEAVRAAYGRAKTAAKSLLTRLKMIKPAPPPAAEPAIPKSAWAKATVGKRVLALSLTYAAYTAVAFIVTRIILAVFRWVNKSIKKEQ